MVNDAFALRAIGELVFSEGDDRLAWAELQLYLGDHRITTSCRIGAWVVRVGNLLPGLVSVSVIPDGGSEKMAYIAVIDVATGKITRTGKNVIEKKKQGRISVLAARIKKALGF